jgi:hypothetical protein
MPDAWLIGNGTRCPACELRRESDQERDRLGLPRLVVTCNACGGLGRLPRPVGEIVQAEAAEARRNYWLALDRRH